MVEVISLLYSDSVLERVIVFCFLNPHATRLTKKNEKTYLAFAAI